MSRIRLTITTTSSIIVTISSSIIIINMNNMIVIRNTRITVTTMNTNSMVYHNLGRIVNPIIGIV